MLRESKCLPQMTFDSIAADGVPVLLRNTQANPRDFLVVGGTKDQQVIVARSLIQVVNTLEITGGPQMLRFVKSEIGTVHSRVLCPHGTGGEPVKRSIETTGDSSLSRVRVKSQHFGFRCLF